MAIRISTRYKTPIAVALCFQVFLVLVATTVLDFGVLLHVSLNALVVFWVAAWFEIRRYPLEPRSFGLYFVKYGYLGVLPITYCLSVLVRQVMGQPLP